MKTEPKFAFCMQLWGKQYVEIFLEAGLPAQMVKGNLIDFPWLSSSTYEIFTTHEDMQTLKQAKLFQQLQSIINVKFHLIDDIIYENESNSKWKVVRHCNQSSAKIGDDSNAAVFYLQPDQLWTQGSFVNAANKILSGYTAVLCPGPRTIAEKLIPCIKKIFLLADGSMPLPAREFVKIGMQNLHPETILWHWDRDDFCKVSTYLLYNVPDAGITAFCFALHPLVMKPEVKFAPFKKIFDQDYLAAACPTFERIYVARDSDEVFHFEVSPENIPYPYYRFSWLEPKKLLAWYTECNYTWQQRLIIKKPIRIHYAEIDEAKWSAIETKGYEVVKELERWWQIPDYKLAFLHPEHYLSRYNGRYKFDENKISIADKILKKIAIFMSKIVHSYIGTNEFKDLHGLENL